MRKMPQEYVVDGKMAPDFWVTPHLVLEVGADEITRSPIHTCGRDSEGIGYALRFPRLEVFRRDKVAEDCTTEREVLTLFENQVVPK